MELDKTRKIRHIIVHAGQHYSYDLDGIFFEELGVRQPDYNLEIGSGTQGEQTARLILRSESNAQRETRYGFALGRFQHKPCRDSRGKATDIW